MISDLILNYIVFKRLNPRLMSSVCTLIHPKAGQTGLFGEQNACCLSLAANLFGFSPSSTTFMCQTRKPHSQLLGEGGKTGNRL